jgi:hypothetical protein
MKKAPPSVFKAAKAAVKTAAMYAGKAGFSAKMGDASEVANCCSLIAAKAEKVAALGKSFDDPKWTATKAAAMSEIWAAYAAASEIEKDLPNVEFSEIWEN